MTIPEALSLLDHLAVLIGATTALIRAIHLLQHPKLPTTTKPEANEGA